MWSSFASFFSVHRFRGVSFRRVPYRWAMSVLLTTRSQGKERRPASTRLARPPSTTTRVTSHPVSTIPPLSWKTVAMASTTRYMPPVVNHTPPTLSR